MCEFLSRHARGRRGPARRSAGWALALLVLVPAGATVAGEEDRSADFRAPGANATLAEIEACASRNLPDSGGVIGFRVEAVDRSGIVTTSRAEMRWRKDDHELAQVLLRVSEPARTAGTTLLIVDRAAEQPEFYIRLPELERVKRVRSRRLRGPVLGTDFSYEDLKRFREPLEKTGLELVGTAELDGRPAWLLETVPREEDDSEYSRVLTWVEQEHCLPVRVDLFEGEDRLRKRLEASRDEIRLVGSNLVPHEFVMRDLRRETQTIVRIEHVEVKPDLPAGQFTKRALQDSPPAARSR